MSYMSKGLFKNKWCIISDIIENKKINPDVITEAFNVKSLFNLFRMLSPAHIKNQVADILGIIPKIKLTISILLVAISLNKRVSVQDRMPTIPNTDVVVNFFHNFSPIFYNINSFKVVI